MASANGSKDRANKTGDNGQPCLLPLVNLKSSERRLFTKSGVLGAAYRARIAFKKQGPKENFVTKA